MLIIENIRLAISGLKANKMRALLTMLGIIIGISSVIAIMTVGNSLKQQLSSSSPTENAITVGVQQYIPEGENYDTYPKKNAEDKDLLSVSMIEDMVNEFGDRIESVTATESLGQVKVENDKKYANISVNGLNKYAMKYEELKMAGGRIINEKEINNAAMVCVVSDYFVNNMFGGNIEKALGSPVEVTIKNKAYNFTIVGVYTYVERSFSMIKTDPKDTVTNMYIPVRVAKRINKTENYQSVSVIPKMDVDVQGLSDEIKEYMDNKYYKNKAVQDFEIFAFSYGAILGQLSDMMSTLTTAISIIAGIALLVGGIGVMNIMLVSITERTREIGTRKALGAPNSSIRIQFIVESIVICVIGGIIGTIIGIAGGYVACQLMAKSIGEAIFKLSPESIVIAVGFSLFIGVFFGYYPANKAAKLDPIEALRYE